MPRKNKVDTGQRYGYLEITKDLGITKLEHVKRISRFVVAKCLRCGSGEKVYRFDHLKNGSTVSCGCIHKEKTKESNTRHGFCGTRQYQVWSNIITRCNNPRSTMWEYYGGRGITVCEKWLTFEGFWEDMREGYSDNLEIDRIDVDGNYCKENCRWVTRSENCYNTRKNKSNKSGKTGVHFNVRDQVWIASICINGRLKHLGSFPTFEPAVAAREAAEIEIYGYTKP